MSTSTVIETAPKSETATNVNVDAGFVKAFEAIELEKVNSSKKLGGKWAKVARYAIEHGLTRDVILASLKSISKEETAQSNTSRILDLMKPENAWKLEKMESGELSVRDSRSTTVKLSADGKTIIRTAPAVRPPSVRIAASLQDACNVAIAEKVSLAELTDKLNVLFFATQDAKAKPATNGEKESSDVSGN